VSRAGARSAEPEGSGTLGEGRENRVIDCFALIGQDHDGTIGPLVETLGAAGIIDRNTGDKSSLAGPDLGLEEFPAPENRRRTKQMGASKKLLLNLLPARGGDHDASSGPAVQTPEGRRSQDRRSLSGAVTGNKCGGMLFADVA